MPSTLLVLAMVRSSTQRTLRSVLDVEGATCEGTTFSYIMCVINKMGGAYQRETSVAYDNKWQRLNYKFSIPLSYK